MSELEKLQELKKKLYVKKTENPSVGDIANPKDSPSYKAVKAKAVVVESQGELALKLLGRTIIPSKLLFLNTKGLPLKLGQVLEVFLSSSGGEKWQVEVPYAQLYKEVSLGDERALTHTSLILANMNMPPKAKEAAILDRFFVTSLWAKRFLAMGILNKKTCQELSLMNAYSNLQWGEPDLNVLKKLFSLPFKGKNIKRAVLYWYVVPFETVWGSTKRRGSLNLAFEDKKFFHKGIKQWSLIFPLNYDFLILQVKEGRNRTLKLTLPNSWVNREKFLVELKERLQEQKLGVLSYCFLDAPSKSVDAWQEEFNLNE